MTQIEKEVAINFPLEKAKYINDAIREKAERENPRPLTLEQLRGMNGEPVWVDTMQDWRIVYVDDENEIVRLYSVFNTTSAEHVMNDDGNIYRHNKEGNNNG